MPATAEITPCTKVFIPDGRSEGQLSRRSGDGMTDSGISPRCEGAQGMCYLALWVRKVTRSFDEDDPNLGLHSTPEMFLHFIGDMERFLDNGTCQQPEALKEALAEARAALQAL